MTLYEKLGRSQKLVRFYFENYSEIRRISIIKIVLHNT